MKHKELYHKIDRYFDGELSSHEERQLLKELLPLEGQDPLVDEALAVMLASRLPAKLSNRKRHPMRLMAGIAAAVVAIFAIGVLIHYPTHSRNSGMIAYVGGEKVENPKEIMNIIDNQLSDIGESSEFFAQTVSADLDDICSALNSEGI